MKHIPLTRGFSARVDDGDFEELNRHKWCALPVKGGKVYAARGIASENRLVLMHRQIMRAGPGIEVDHRDGNGLHCTRDNMRLATRRQNCLNRGPSPKNATGYKGVSLARQTGKYVACIQHEKRPIRLGTFSNPIDAARAYNQAALHYHGEFAYLNPIPA